MKDINMEVEYCGISNQDDFYNLDKEIDSKYSDLKKHILRIQNSLKNF